MGENNNYSGPIIASNENHNGLRKDRSRWEIVQDLLNVTKEEKIARKTRIMQRANLDWRNFQRYFGFLLEEGFIENCDSNCYALTKRGEELIQRLYQVDEMLNK
jgi:predicted transcriptional regulator